MKLLLMNHVLLGKNRIIISHEFRGYLEQRAESVSRIQLRL